MRTLPPDPKLIWEVNLRLFAVYCFDWKSLSNHYEFHAGVPMKIFEIDTFFNTVRLFGLHIDFGI